MVLFQATIEMDLMLLGKKIPQTCTKIRKHITKVIFWLQLRNQDKILYQKSIFILRLYSAHW